MLTNSGLVVLLSVFENYKYVPVRMYGLGGGFFVALGNGVKPFCVKTLFSENR